MGIEIRLQDEKGKVTEEVRDPHGLVAGLLPASDDPRFHVIKFIDAYGDTVFNRLQIAPFLDEWEWIAHQAASAEARELHARIKQLALACQHGLHTYLKFVGGLIRTGQSRPPMRLGRYNPPAFV